MESNCGQRLRLPPTAKTRKPNWSWSMGRRARKLRGLYDKLYKLAVITGEEDQQINDAGLRAKMLSSPEEHWL